MNIERMPAARAACRPAVLSSNTSASAGSTPSARAASRNASGVGFADLHGIAADARLRRHAIGDAELRHEIVDDRARARGDDGELQAAGRRGPDGLRCAGNRLHVASRPSFQYASIVGGEFGGRRA